jgi:hypothetical protein
VNGASRPAKWRVLYRAVLLLALLVPTLAAAAPRAWLDRDSIRLGETVTLNVETDARGGSEPDFSVLDREFRRLGTSSSTQLSYNRGRQSARTLWAVALEPRQAGSFGIPALTVGAERTEPLRLTVLPMPDGGSAAAGDDVYLEVDADPPSPYVQQQVRYTVRLHYAVPLLEGQLEEPQLAGARISKIGQDVQYSTTLHGRRYTVVERRYALIPEASGTLELPGPQFRGRALLTGGYGSLLNRNAILSARGNQLTLEVRPRPAAAAEPWLPAQSLQLLPEGPPLPERLQVGEPLTLTLRLRAQGLAAEQLPELVLPAIEGAQVYPDQEASQTRDDGQWLMGERVRKFAIVPMRPGPLELPEIGVDWWDVGGDRAARASLPARRIEVAAAPGAGAVAPDAVPAPVDAGAATAPEAASTQAMQRLLQPWPLAALAFAALWLATLALLWRRRRNAAAAPPRGPAAATPPPAWRSAWEGALQRGDMAALDRTLVEAGHARDPRCHNLESVAAQLGEEAQRALVLRLERLRYRGALDAPLLEDLRRGFARGPRWRTDGTPAAADVPLPPLYPERN